MLILGAWERRLVRAEVAHLVRRNEASYYFLWFHPKFVDPFYRWERVHRDGSAVSWRRCHCGVFVRESSRGEARGSGSKSRSAGAFAGLRKGTGGSGHGKDAQTDDCQIEEGDEGAHRSSLLHAGRRRSVCLHRLDHAHIAYHQSGWLGGFRDEGRRDPGRVVAGGRRHHG